MSINRVSKINVKYTDGSEYVFNSITECSKSLGVGMSLIKKFADSGKQFSSIAHPKHKGIEITRLEGVANLDNFVDLKYKDVKQIYLIDACGNIISKYNNSLKKPNSDRDGYLRIFLRTNNKSSTSQRVATLVAHTFIGQPPNNMKDPTVDHIDGNKRNNNVDNLMWMERGDNAKKAHVGISVGDNNHFYGKTHSEETKEKMRGLNIGKKYSKDVNSKKASPKVSLAIYQNETREFNSAKALAEHLGIAYTTGIRYLRGERGGPTHYYKPYACHLFYKGEISDIEIVDMLKQTTK